MIGQQPFATVSCGTVELPAGSFVTVLLEIDPFAGVHHAEFWEYLPFTIPIGLVLLWYVRGLFADWIGDFLRVRRRRFLRVIRRDGQVRSYGYRQHYLGELGPCLGSPFYEPWQHWRSRYRARLTGARRTAPRSSPRMRKGA